MLSRYPVACPHESCGWTGSLTPSQVRGGAEAEFASMQRAWLHCPPCPGDGEVHVNNGGVTVLPRAAPGD
jgi:hypothetical protein